MNARPTKALAEFVCGLTYDDLPSGVTSKVRESLLDAFGCALFGQSLEWGKIVTGLAKDRSSRSEATVIGAGFRADLEYAGLANGILIHSFDFDDYHRAKVHPAAAVIPAALAMAEFLDLPGRRLVEAIAAGYETMIRISLGTGPNDSRNRGWHLTGTCGTFGAAAAVAKLLGFNVARTQSALGLAGAQSAGLWAFNTDGSMSKRFHPGRAATSGLLAGMLVERGFTGPSQILEAEDGGFCRATSDNVDLDLITKDLGERFEMQDVCTKPYACCGSLHPLVDAALALRHDYQIAVEDIEQVSALASEGVRLQTGWDYKPSTVLNAQMSMKYCVAAALSDGEVNARQFTEQRIKDAALVRLAGLVRFEPDSEFDRLYPARWAGEVRVGLRDREPISRRVYDAKGTPVNPLNHEDVLHKFAELAQFGGIASASRIVDGVENIAHLESTRQLTSLLVP